MVGVGAEGPKYIIDMGGFISVTPEPQEPPILSIAALVAAAAGGEGRTQWGQALLASGEYGG